MHRRASMHVHFPAQQHEQMQYRLMHVQHGQYAGRPRAVPGGESADRAVSGSSTSRKSGRSLIVVARSEPATAAAFRALAVARDGARALGNEIAGAVGAVSIHRAALHRKVSYP